MDWLVGATISCKRGAVPELDTDPTCKNDWGIFVKKIVGGVVIHLPTWHKEHGPTEMHWWVRDAGADPSFQGCGYGKELMNRTGHATDRVDISCYLYCAGEKNKCCFYEKVGYTVSSHKVVICDGHGPYN